MPEAFWLLELLPSSYFSAFYMFFLRCGILGIKTQVMHPGGGPSEGGAGVGPELIRASLIRAITMPLGRGTA